MKIPHTKLIKLIVPFCIYFILFSCSKDTDLLADYVVLDPQEAKLVVRSVKDDRYVSANTNPIILNVLNNDSFLDLSKVKIIETTIPRLGNVEINDDNTLTYTFLNNSDSEATDTFTYTTETISEDETTDTETGTVTVTKNPNYGELKAFPTAYGAGSNASGARGGNNSTVYHVTNLNDSGPGSFRDAVSQSNRYIVFDVSGTIDTRHLEITGENLTIAGQTAPEGGITLSGARTQFSNVNNMILRYITFRPDFNTEQRDAVSFSHCTNIIIDHVSSSWGSDEILTFDSGGHSISMQRTLLAEGSKTGSLLGNSDNPELTYDMSVHNCLWYSTSHRFPNVNTNGRADVINNVVYNWNYRLVRAQGEIQMNHINNYYFRQQKGEYTNQMNKYAGYNINTAPKLYTAGNLVMPGILTDPSADNWSTWTTFGSWSWDGKSYDKNTPQPLPKSFKKSTSFPLLGNALRIKGAESAFVDVTNDVGNNKRVYGSGNIVENQDNIDALFLNNVKNDNHYSYTYTDNTRIGKYSHYIQFQASISSTPIAKHPEGYDTDRDGIPDEWEIAKGLDPNKKDHNEDPDGNGYTNIEEYINLVDF